MKPDSTWRSWIVWVAAAVGAVILWWHAEPGRNALPAVVGAARHQLGAVEPGRIRAVLVKPGEAVHAGQALVEFDCSDLDAELGVARAAAEEHFAAIEALAAELTAEARRRRADVEAELARARATLSAAKGLQAAQRAELDALNQQMKRLDQVIRNRLTDVDRLSSLRARQLRLTSRTQHGPETVEAWSEVAEQMRQALKNFDDDTVAVRLQPLKARLETQNRRVQRLLERQSRCTVRAPDDGSISAVPHVSGDAVAVGATVVVEVSARATYVTAYLPENGRRLPHPGDPVVVYPRDRRSGQAARGVVDALGPEIVELPPRLWIAPNRPMYGRPIHIQVETGADLLPGELAFVHEDSGQVQAASVTPQLSFPARVPDALRQRTRLELSGLAWLPERGRFLAVSDDTGFPGRDAGTPWVFTTDADGQLDADPLPLRGVDAVSDLESVARAPGGTVYLLASQSLSRAGRRPVKRQWLLRAQPDAQGLTVTGKLALYDQLLAHLDAELRSELGVTDELNIEGMTWHGAGLLIGLKTPLDAAGRARIWRIADVDALLASAGDPEHGELPAAAQLSLFGTVALPTCSIGAPGGISDLYAEGDRLYVLSSVPHGMACGSAWRIDLPLGQTPPRKLADWPDAVPEGIARAGQGSLLIAFDTGPATPRFAKLADQ
jgi:multidrug resistance efflux pump